MPAATHHFKSAIDEVFDTTYYPLLPTDGPFPWTKTTRHFGIQPAKQVLALLRGKASLNASANIRESVCDQCFAQREKPAARAWHRNELRLDDRCYYWCWRKGAAALRNLSEAWVLSKSNCDLLIAKMSLKSPKFRKSDEHDNFSSEV